MRKIDITINKAVIEEVSVTIKEKYPEVSVCIGLYAGAKRISSYSIRTDSWDDKNKFSLPPHVAYAIGEMLPELETIATRKCSASIGALAESVTKDVPLEQQPNQDPEDDLPF